jgi:hypothetical protein
MGLIDRQTMLPIIGDSQRPVVGHTAAMLLPQLATCSARLPL